MRQGTTPIVSLKIAADFDNCNVFVTIDQDGEQITKSSRESDDIEIVKRYNEHGEFDHSTVAVYLTQPETLGFEVGRARVQVRWIDILGTAHATNIGSFPVDESLLEEVIDYGN